MSKQAGNEGRVLFAKIVIVVGALLVLLGFVIVIGMRWEIITERLQRISDFLIDQPCCLGALISFMGVIVLAIGIWYHWLSRNPEPDHKRDVERPRKKSPSN